MPDKDLERKIFEECGNLRLRRESSDGSGYACFKKGTCPGQSAHMVEYLLTAPLMVDDRKTLPYCNFSIYADEKKQSKG